jgi:hypothetical protein
LLVVNSVKVETARDLVNILRKPSRLWKLTIQRGSQQISATSPG